MGVVTSLTLLAKIYQKMRPSTDRQARAVTDKLNYNLSHAIAMAADSYFGHLLLLLGRIVRNTYVGAAYCYRPSSAVCLSVGMSH